MISAAAPRVAAGALFVDAAGRILLVHPTYKPGWDIPGGYVEPGESPAAACHRELREELSIDRPPQRLLTIDWAPDGSCDRLLFVFDCGPLGDDEDRIRVDGDEIDQWTWVAPDDLDDHVNPRLARRLRSSLASPDTAGVYLENGGPVA